MVKVKALFIFSVIQVYNTTSVNMFCKLCIIYKGTQWMC